MPVDRPFPGHPLPPPQTAAGAGAKLRGPSPIALSATERQAVLDVLHQPRYADLALTQVWARELDENRYHASVSTMYRILREKGETRERRRQGTHPPRKKPELMANGPSQIWSWDITKLRGPDKGIWYQGDVPATVLAAVRREDVAAVSRLWV